MSANLLVTAAKQGQFQHLGPCSNFVACPSAAKEKIFAAAEVGG